MFQNPVNTPPMTVPSSSFRIHVANLATEHPKDGYISDTELDWLFEEHAGKVLDVLFDLVLELFLSLRVLIVLRILPSAHKVIKGSQRLRETCVRDRLLSHQYCCSICRVSRYV